MKVVSELMLILRWDPSGRRPSGPWAKPRSTGRARLARPWPLQLGSGRLLRKPTLFAPAPGQPSTIAQAAKAQEGRHDPAQHVGDQQIGRDRGAAEDNEAHARLRAEGDGPYQADPGQLAA